MKIIETATAANEEEPMTTITSGVATFTTAPNKPYSGYHDLSATPVSVPGKSVTIVSRLLPIEIVDSTQTRTQQLKVAKMIEFGVINQNRAIIPDNDLDCFSIRIRGAARFGPISVKVGTADNPEPTEYNDNPTQIDLHADGDDMVSDTQLLVADDEDDIEPIGGVADNQPNDRTHKIQLGENFVISAVKVGTNPWMAIELKTPVKVVKTVQVNAVIFYNKAISAGGVLAATHPQVEKYFKTTKERYAQVGVKIEMIGPVDKEPAAGVDLTSPLVISQNKDSFVLFNDPKALIQEAGTLDASDIHVFFVPQAKYAIGLPFLGTSLPQFAYGASEGGYIYNAFVSMDKINSLEQGGLTVAHELGHLLRNGGHETWFGEDSLIQLMVDHSFKLDGVLSSKRFTIADETKIQNDSHAH